MSLLKTFLNGVLQQYFYYLPIQGATYLKFETEDKYTTTQTATEAETSKSGEVLVNKL